MTGCRTCEPNRHAAAQKRWQTKAKRAATALKTLRRQQAYYERKLAA